MEKKRLLHEKAIQDTIENHFNFKLFKGHIEYHNDTVKEDEERNIVERGKEHLIKTLNITGLQEALTKEVDDIKEILQHLKIVQGPVRYLSEDKLHPSEKESGSLIEVTSMLINSNRKMFFPIKMIVSSKGKFADKLCIRAMDKMDYLNPVVDEYQKNVLAFTTPVMKKRNVLLFEVAKTNHFSELIKEWFVFTNKEPFKERYSI